MAYFVLIALMANLLFESENLTLRRFTAADGAFIFELLNTPGWKQFIGDKSVHSIEDAVNYITTILLAGYEKNGYGAYLVALKSSGQAIGMCGLFKRGYLDLPDLGFALLPAFEGKGYGYECSMATIAYAGSHYHITGLYATTDLNNARSQKLLVRCGFLQKGQINPEGTGLELMLYYRDL